MRHDAKFREIVESPSSDRKNVTMRVAKDSTGLWLQRAVIIVDRVIIVMDFDLIYND